MTTPQQFIDSFLRGRAAARAATRAPLEEIYTEYCGGRLLEHAAHFMPDGRVDEVCEDVKESNGCARVITRWDLGRGVVKGTRYHLSAAGESWRIIRMDWDCTWCHNTGRLLDAACDKCDGEGWFDPLDRILNPTLEWEPSPRQPLTKTTKRRGGRYG